MVSLDVVRAANAQISTTYPSDLTAVFFGATSGIGESTLKQFVAALQDKKPRVYVIGRNAKAAEPLIAKLRQSNASADVTLIVQDISLVRNVEKVVDEIKKREEKVDFLYLSPGFIPFDGRKDTSEGLDPSMTTRYYSRARAIQLLLPLLNRSHTPHVTNVLAGGQEGALIEDDLELAKPGNFSFIQASIQSASMLTLALEKFAAENPKISFVHAYPGVTSTPVLSHGTSGILGFFIRWIAGPILSLFAYPVDHVGAKTLFYFTNARYSVQETADLATALPEGLTRAKQTAGGIWLVGEKGEVTDNEKVLQEWRPKIAKVWEHTTEVFDRVSQ